MSVVNALSERLEWRSGAGGKVYVQSYKRGASSAIEVTGTRIVAARK
jgi:DNA gyrase/topoisomerase IV subunit B